MSLVDVMEAFSFHFNSLGTPWPEYANRAWNELNKVRVVPIVTEMTESELVAATNEYISRAISRTHECTGAPHVFISAYAYNRDKYTIDHNLSLGKPEIKLEGGNLFELVEKHKIIQNFPTTLASEIIPMLSAPEPLIEEAHFTEIPRNCFSGADDDMPF